MDLTGYEVPRVLVTCRSQQLEVEGDGNENVPLYYYINDNITIQFGREKFCLVTGLRFGVENLADYNDVELPIPFRRRVFSSYLDGEHITCNMVFRIIDDELFDILHDDDAVSLCCLGILQLVLLGVGTLAEIDGPGCDNIEVRTTILRAQSATPYWQPAFLSHPGTYSWQSPIPSHIGNLNLEPPIERHYDAAGLFNQNIPNRGKREQRPSFYKRTLYMEQPPTTVLPKQRGNKNKNNVMNANLSPLNLGNAFDDENEGGADVIFLGDEFTGNYLVYENIDPEKVK
nr:phospholipase-like protein [Tanacetum cinerariifolium]